MSKLNFKTSVVISTIISLSLILASCGGGSAASYSPGSRTASTNGPITTTVSISAADSTVAYNGTTVITWSSTESDSCTSSTSGITGTSGRYTTEQLTTNNATYTITCIGPTGAASKSISIPVTGGSIVVAATACANAPIRGSTVYYYCDCGTGKETGCVPGFDTDNLGNVNPGTSPLAPRRTFGNAAARFSTLAANDTVALCKGGAFDTVGDHSLGSSNVSNRCALGDTCYDLREYTPPSSIFVGTAKPIINITAGDDKPLFRFSASGGVRILNLKLKGDVVDGNGKMSSNSAFYIAYGGRDVTMCNLDIDGFGVSVYSESDDGLPGTAGNTKNIKLTGSMISNSRNQGFLGGSDDMQINYNYWDGNGSFSVFTHALYFSSNNTSVVNMEVIGNHVYGQYGDKCRGVVIVGHVAIDGLRFENNTVEIDAAAATPTCYGIGFGAAGQAGAKYMRNTNFSNNTVINGGDSPLSVGECPNCLIENNLIIQNWVAPWPVNGISLGFDSPRAEDDVSHNVRIRNNTVWFGPNNYQGGIGISVGNEPINVTRAQGTGHIIVNNTVTYASTTSTFDVFSCYSYPLALSSYTFINNNHCYSEARFRWEKAAPNLGGGRTLAEWKDDTATARSPQAGFDTASITAVAPNFTTPGTDFKPVSPSPLIGSGNTTYGSSYIGAFAP